MTKVGEAFCRALFIALVLSAGAQRLDACTLWGVVVTNGVGGTLVCKNRDWTPDHTQELKNVRPKKGYAYYGLFAVGGSEPGLKAGVNEKGLAVVAAATSCLPKGKRDHQPGKHGVLARLLVECATCDEVLARKDSLFSGARATFLLIADRSKLLSVEVGLDGKFAVAVVTAGTVAHTNHYLDPSLAAFNELVSHGSRVRLDRVTQLLQAQPTPCTVDACAAISRDQHDGPTNSLWRIGTNVRTMASWIVELPANGVPRVRALLADPGRSEALSTVALDAAFWNGGPVK